MIAATNWNPRDAIRDGKLREDLYFRVNVFAIDLPPLRERADDIAPLVAHFIAKHDARRGAHAPTVDDALLARLKAYRWPGNVRELENVIERALILAGEGPVTSECLRLDAESASAGRDPDMDDGALRLGPLNPAVEELEARLIELALKATGDNKARAAALLEISERALWYKLKKYRAG